MVVYVLTCKNTDFCQILTETFEKCHIHILYVSDNDCRVRTNDSLTTLYIVNTDEEELVERLELLDYLVGFRWHMASSLGIDVKKIALYRTLGQLEQDEYEEILKKADASYVIMDMDGVYSVCTCTDDPCNVYGYLVYIESTSTELNTLPNTFFEKLFSCSVE